MSVLHFPANENAGGHPGESSAISKKYSANRSRSVGRCASLLARLRKAPATKCEARRMLDVYDPPSRVLRLRQRDHEIVTVRDRAKTEAGVIHRANRYSRIKEAV